MTRIYVGNLPIDIRTRDIEDLFWKYGRIRDIDCKTPSRPPAFAFVSFEKYEDAEDAVRGRDGVQFEGQRLRVEMSRASAEVNDDRGSRRYDDRQSGGSRGGPPPRSLRPPPRDLRRSEHRVIVSGLPPSASWQDLKDFFRPAGDVIYTDVDRQGGGIVEFANKEDQEYAVNKLDDTEFKNPFHSCYIRVKKPNDQLTDADRARSKEREADRSRRDRERPRRSSESRSRSRSRSRGKKRNRSRSHSSSEPRRGRGSKDAERGGDAEKPAKEESDAPPSDVKSEEPLP